MIMLLVMLVVMLFGYATPGYARPICPNGLILNEIFTLGEHQTSFSGSYPYIEFARKTDGEISLDKYSIAVFGLNKQNLFRLRQEPLNSYLDGAGIKKNLKLPSFWEYSKFMLFGNLNGSKTNPNFFFENISKNTAARGGQIFGLIPSC